MGFFPAITHVYAMKTVFMCDISEPMQSSVSVSFADSGKQFLHPTKFSFLDEVHMQVEKINSHNLSRILS